MLYAFFWVIPQRLNFICRRFVTLCLFHLHGRIGVETITIINMLEKSSVSVRVAVYEKRGRTPQLAYHKDYVLRLRQQKEVLMQVVKQFRELGANVPQRG